MPVPPGITAIPVDTRNTCPRNDTLPAVRQDLRLFRGPRTADGSPSWTLYDPVRDRYFRLGWAEFEMLARWDADSVSALLEAIGRETTLNITDADVSRLARFLLSQDLTVDHSTQPSSTCGVVTRMGLALQKYLFIKIPLFRPDALLTRILPAVRFIYSKLFFNTLAISTTIALFLVTRQWDSFVSTFSRLASPAVAPWVLTGLVLTKICHEFGHALTAKYYGLRVPTMGVAFLVAWPVLYTDTSAAWRLSDRRARLAIDGAGILAETLLAAVATLLWLLLPDGPQRDAACFIATVTWAITLMVNSNPLLRFDGYYLLCDLINFPNLQQRSFELARWHLRKIIQESDSPAPETHSARTSLLLITYAWSCWVYRLFLFAGIAAFLYYFTFKLLGIVLAASVITWFVLRPVWQELDAWIGICRHLSWNRQTIRITTMLIATLLFLFVPWSMHINVPALLQYEEHAQIYPPYPARIKAVLVRPGEPVSSGQALFEFDSPQLAHRIISNTHRITVLQQQLNQRLAQRDVLERSTVIQEELATAIAERDGLQRQQGQLTVRAGIAGVVADLADGLSPGQYVSTGTRLALIIRRSRQTLYAYVPEQDIDRITTGNPARFTSDDHKIRPVAATVREVVPLASIAPREQLLASEYGGPIPVNKDDAGHLQPASAHYKITLELQNNDNVLNTITRGSVRISCEGESIARRIYQSVAGLILREGGF